MLAANNQILTQHTVQVIKEKHFILNELISEADMAVSEHIGTPLFVILSPGPSDCGGSSFERLRMLKSTEHLNRIIKCIMA